MANPAPTINQINAFNATQGTTIDFNIIGGTELVRSNRIYIYDLSDNSLICTHLYVSTESIHELPPNTDGSIVYESGKSSADFVNGAQYYAQIQTFTDVAGTEGGSGLSVAKMFWCLVDPTLTITTIPSTISTTSYNISATYNANTSVVSNIIQQYQFSLYSATGSLLQSSGVVVGSGTQQGTSTAYDISYNFTGLSVGSSYYVVVDVTTTQGMSVSAQSNTFTVSIDTPTLGEATVVNNACDGYISVTSNLSSEYGGSGSGEIVSFETDSENVFTKLQVDLEPVQDLNGYDKPWVGGAGKNKFDVNSVSTTTPNNWSVTVNNGALVVEHKNTYSTGAPMSAPITLPAGTYSVSYTSSITTVVDVYVNGSFVKAIPLSGTFTLTESSSVSIAFVNANASTITYQNIQIESGSSATSYAPYENICPISGHDEVVTHRTGVNVWDEEWELGYYNVTTGEPATSSQNLRSKNFISVVPNTPYYVKIPTGYIAICEYDADKNFIKCTQGIINSGITTTANTHFIRFHCTSAYGTTYNNDISINYPSTDHNYHAYNGQTYTQDIEATYTPMVQENEPYQFKRTGDVGGDRESIELVGGTVAWNQLVLNPLLDGNVGVASGTTSYSSTNKTRTITSNGNGNCWATVPSGGRYPASHVYLLMIDEMLDANNTQDFSNMYLHVSWQNGSKAISLAPKGTWKTCAAVVKPNTEVTNLNVYPFATLPTPADQICYLRNASFFDLTQMFGSTIADYIYLLEQANAGAGVAWFRKLFPKPYYAYNAGELMSVNTSAHNTVGFNQWDEEWEQGGINNTTGQNAGNAYTIRTKNYVPILPNTTYYVKAPINVRAYWYDSDKNYITTISIGSASTFVTPVDAHYMRFIVGNSANPVTTYSNDICINLSKTTGTPKNGDYVAYESHSYALDGTLTLRGIPKIANGKLYYDGDTYASDGTVTRKYGVVDLGTLNWSSGTDSVNTVFFATIPNLKYVADASVVNAICPKFTAITKAAWSGASINVDKVFRSDNSASILYFRDLSYTGSTAFKTAMSGVYLVYELATPTTETADQFEEIQICSPYGTEEFVDNRAVPIPVGNNTQYYTRDIYGGTLDLVTGVLTVTWGYSNLGVLNYSKSSSPQRFEATTTLPNAKAPTSSSVALNGLCTDYEIYSIDAYSGQDSAMYMSTTGLLRIYDSSRYSLSASDFKTAMNNIYLAYELATPTTYQLTPQQIQTLVGVNNVWSEQGDIELSYHIPITNLLVKRQDVDDVSGSWLTLYSQPITQASDMDFTFVDFTNQYGKTYKYALVPLLTQTQSGVEVEVEGGYTVSDEVQSVFDGVFIVDSTGSQKCKANVGYGNVDMNQTVGTITPIGAKYPVVITNSKNQYHNGSISGTIVPDDYYFNGNLSRIDMVNKRDELEQFLTNKRAKIIKDWNGKIWLVMIMDNVSCTFNNNYGMGIVNFSTNWVEVGDPTNQQDLQATGLINVGGV